MKKILSILLLIGLCASTVSVNAFPGGCVHIHNHSDDWAGPMAFGAIMGTGLGLAASAASHNHETHYVRVMANDLEEQNAILQARINALKERCADLRAENEDLREQNEALRRKIRKMKHCGSELMVTVDTGN